MLKDYSRPEDGLDKTQIKEETAKLQARLSALQPTLRGAHLPVIVLIEGWGAAGKGTLINDLISELDPRFAGVFCADRTPRDAERYPFLYPYFNAIPEEGKLLFMDGGWMEATVRAAMTGELRKKEYRRRLLSVRRFERQLRDSGYLLLKLFIHISKETQVERFRTLCDDENTAWRVTAEDLWQNEDYGGFRKAYEDFMAETGDPQPWIVLDGSKKSTLKYDAFKLLVERIEGTLTAGKPPAPPAEADFSMQVPLPRLSDADLSARLSPEDYREQLKTLQKKLVRLHNDIYRKHVPVVICCEGWDAAGKGGCIRRLAYPLDPRGFEVFPIAAPSATEKARHFLWRFWTRLPRAGRIAIFDRSWYGRVLAERVEGFCSEDDWRRAYNEINEFEQELTDFGAVVLKFWLHIDQETQLRRFTQRQNTPEKAWKLTDEDWRNREKWPQYEAAVNEMLEKTSTEEAPWHIIESNDKLYARIKLLRIVADALERALDGGKE